MGIKKKLKRELERQAGKIVIKIAKEELKNDSKKALKVLKLKKK